MSDLPKVLSCCKCKLFLTVLSFYLTPHGCDLNVFVCLSESFVHLCGSISYLLNTKAHKGGTKSLKGMSLTFSYSLVIPSVSD